MGRKTGPVVFTAVSFVNFERRLYFADWYRELNKAPWTPPVMTMSPWVLLYFLILRELHGFVGRIVFGKHAANSTRMRRIATW